MISTGLRAGEELDRATWSREIISHTSDPIWRDNPGGIKRRRSKRFSFIINMPSDDGAISMRMHIRCDG